MIGFFLGFMFPPSLLAQVMSDGNGGLSMSAVGGSITLESAECGVTDLCGLARDFQALMARLGGE